MNLMKPTLIEPCSDTQDLMNELTIINSKISIEAGLASLLHTKAGLSQSESVGRLTKLAFIFMSVSFLAEYISGILIQRPY